MQKLRKYEKLTVSSGNKLSLIHCKNILFRLILSELGLHRHCLAENIRSI